jgi:tetratricopeptide (TPR) repeat protein
MHDLVGKQLGDFDILRELGRGGMGVVYEAHQRSLNRRVALKVLADHLVFSDRAVARFHREAESAGRLRHPNIVPIHATGNEGGVHYYAMELLEGPGLDVWLRQQRQDPNKDSTLAETIPTNLQPTRAYTPAEVPTLQPTPAPTLLVVRDPAYFERIARWVAEVAEALEYAHCRGVIHRDIKPSNLLLSGGDRLHISDFGLALMLEKPGMTMTGEMVGTPSYMSPEQIAAGRVAVDHRTDIYSLGATLYELLTFQPPFVAEGRDQLLTQVIQKEPVPPRRLNPAVPRDLETICLRCLEKEPERRYRSAGELAADLRRFLAGQPILARRLGWIGRGLRWVRRSPGIVTALLGVILALGVAGFFAWRVYHVEQAHQTEQRQNALEKAILAAMSGEAEQAEAAVTEAERLRVAPGQLAMLRGILAYYQGNEIQAMERLKEAIRLLGDAPGHVAAAGMLAYLSPPEQFERLLQDLQKMQPETPEDYLFVGMAVAQWNPDEGIAAIRKARTLRPTSPLPRLALADALSNRATNHADVADAEESLREIERVRAVLPDSPTVVANSAWMHLAAAAIFEEQGKAEKAQTTLARARELTLELKRYPQVPLAVENYAYFFWYRQNGELTATLPELRRLADETHFSGVSVIAAYAMWWQGGEPNRQEALALLKARQDAPIPTLLRSLLLADGGDTQKALALYDTLCKRDEEGYIRIRFASLPLLLGRKDLVRAGVAEDRRRGVRFPPRQQAFFAKLQGYLLGETPEPELLTSAAGSKWNEAMAWYFIGLMRLADGQRDLARTAFDNVVKTRTLNMAVHDLSLIFRHKLADPNWRRPGSD